MRDAWNVVDFVVVVISLVSMAVPSVLFLRVLRSVRLPESGVLSRPLPSSPSTRTFAPTTLSESRSRRTMLRVPLLILATYLRLYTPCACGETRAPVGHLDAAKDPRASSSGVIRGRY